MLHTLELKASLFSFVLLFVFDACSHILFDVLLSVGFILVVSSFIETPRGLLRHDSI